MIGWRHARARLVQHINNYIKMAFHMTLKQHLTALLFLTILVIESVILSLLLYVVLLFKLVIPHKKCKHYCRILCDKIVTLWTGIIVFFIHHCFPTRWTIETSETLTPKNWYLVICNHQSWVDIVAIIMISHKQLPPLKFFIKDQLKWVPLLGLAWIGLEYPLMKRYSKEKLKKHPHLKGRDIAYTKKSCKHYKDKPTCILNFPEGTRFSKEKKQLQQSPYQHLLKPKAGGIAYTLVCMNEYINQVIDMTISYPGGVKSIWAFMGGTVPEVKVVLQQNTSLQKSINDDYFDNPATQTQFKNTINELWKEKDQLLHSMTDTN